LQAKAPYDDGASKRGGLNFKPGKDAYIHLTLKHCINVFKFYNKNSQWNHLKNNPWAIIARDLGFNPAIRKRMREILPSQTSQFFGFEEC
jgi:hypothetical protein